MYNHIQMFFNIFGQIIKTFSLIIIGVGDIKIENFIKKLDFHIPYLGDMIIEQQETISMYCAKSIKFFTPLL